MKQYEESKFTLLTSEHKEDINQCLSNLMLRTSDILPEQIKWWYMNAEFNRKDLELFGEKKTRHEKLS